MKGHWAACIEGLDEGKHDRVIDIGMGETEGMANLVHKGLQDRQQFSRNANKVVISIKPERDLFLSES